MDAVFDKNAFFKNTDELKKLTESEDGKAVRQALSGSGDKLSKAYAEGDTETLANALKSVMSTEEGARIVGKLSEMLGMNSERN